MSQTGGFFETSVPPWWRQIPVKCRHIFPDCTASQIFTLAALRSPNRNVFSWCSVCLVSWLYFRSMPLLRSGFFPPTKKAISFFLTLFFDVIFALLSSEFLFRFLYRLFSVRYLLLLALLCRRPQCRYIWWRTVFLLTFSFIFFFFGGGPYFVYLSIVCQTLCSPVVLLFLLCVSLL